MELKCPWCGREVTSQAGKGVWYHSRTESRSLLDTLSQAAGGNVRSPQRRSWLGWGEEKMEWVIRKKKERKRILIGQINSEMSGTEWSIWNAAFINILAALSQTNLFYGHWELFLLMYWDDYQTTLLFIETGILNVSWGSVLVFHISLCLKTWITKSPLFLCYLSGNFQVTFFLALNSYRRYCYPVVSWSNHMLCQMPQEKG